MRIVTEIWVQAYLRRLSNECVPAFVVSHGDNTAGAVLVKVSTLDGNAALYHRSFDLESGDTKWLELSAGHEKTVDLAIERQKSFDSDVWIIEVEDRFGRNFLDEY